LSPLELSPPKEGGFPRGFASSSASSDQVPGAPRASGAPASSGIARCASSSAAAAAAATSARLSFCHMPLCGLYLSPLALRLVGGPWLAGPRLGTVGDESWNGSPVRTQLRISLALLTGLDRAPISSWSVGAVGGVVGEVGVLGGDAPRNGALIGRVSFWISSVAPAAAKADGA